MQQTIETINLKSYLSKEKICYTIAIVQEAQRNLQEVTSKELFAATDKEDFVLIATQSFDTNSIISEFIEVLKLFKNSKEEAVAYFLNFQKAVNHVDVYDAIEDAFSFYLLQLQIDIEMFTSQKSLDTLVKIKSETEDCYKDVIDFVKNNKW